MEVSHSSKTCGAGMDRITHGWYVKGIRPVELAARAKTALRLVPDGDPQACVDLLGISGPKAENHETAEAAQIELAHSSASSRQSKGSWLSQSPFRVAGPGPQELHPARTEPQRLA